MISHYTIEELRIPFRVSFQHHSATRTETQSILVHLIGNNWSGWGESCPRIYVTGETIHTATQQIHEWLKNGIPFYDLPSWNSFCEAHKDSIENNPAAFCALELAFFDGLSKQKNESIAKILGWKAIDKPFYYTAVLGGGSFQSFQKMAQAHLDLGFKNFKVKISGDQNLDFEKLQWLKFQDQNVRIRLDANNAFPSVEDVLNFLHSLPIQIEALEEPLSSKSTNELFLLLNSINTPIVLDEMALHPSDLEQFKSYGQQIWINLRISKMGGLQQTMEMLKVAESFDFGIVIGSQVGETSLLAHAGLLVAQQAKNLKGLEGGYSDLFLEKDPFLPQIKFGKFGKFDSETLEYSVGLVERKLD